MRYGRPATLLLAAFPSHDQQLLRRNQEPLYLRQWER